jgi:hypothetical protein
LNLTAAVTLVLINKYTVIIATNRLGRNIKTNTNVVNIVGIQPNMKTNTKNTNTKNTQKQTSNKTSKKTKMNQYSPE